MAFFSRLVHAVGDVMVAVGTVVVSIGKVLANEGEEVAMSSTPASGLETNIEDSSGPPSADTGEEIDDDDIDIDTLDRETLFFGPTPEKRQAYKDWAEKHYPVAVLPSACVPPCPESPSDDAVEVGRPLLHYGIGVRMDEVVRFTTEHNRLEAPIRSSLAGMHSAESLADYLSVKARANITVERPLSMEYDWVLAWQNTSDLFRKPGITKSARKVIDEEVQKILGEARKPLWWWDDANTLPRSDLPGN